MEFVKIFESERIIVIKDSLYEQLPITFSVAKQISAQSCNFGFNVIPNGYTLLAYAHITFPTPITPYIIEQMAGYIVGVSKIHTYSLGNEVYGVCTAQNYRGKGIGKIMLKVIVQVFGNFPLWLGVEVENKDFNVATNLYTSVGFGNGQNSICYLPKQSPGGVPISVNVISLQRDPYGVRSPQDAFKVAKTMQLKYYDEKNLCKTPFIIGDNLIRKLHSYLDRDREYAGELVPVGYAANRVVLGFKESTEIRGNDPPDFTVQVPQGSLYFHVHPNICYQKYGCYLGWPSGRDVAIVFYRYIYKHYLMHFVVTNEGLYAITLSPAFMHALKNITESHSYGVMTSHIFHIYKTIEEEFTMLEKYRASSEVSKFGTSSENMLEYIRLYLNKTKMFMYSDLISKAYNTSPELTQKFEASLDQEYMNLRKTFSKILDFHIFEVSYTPWKSELTEIGGGLKGEYHAPNESDICPTVTDVIL